MSSNRTHLSIDIDRAHVYPKIIIEVYGDLSTIHTGTLSRAYVTSRKRQAAIRSKVKVDVTRRLPRTISQLLRSACMPFFPINHSEVHSSGVISRSWHEPQLASKKRG